MRRAQGRRLRLGAAIALAGVLVAGPVLAQGWWPWSNSEEERRPPIPQEPVFRPDEPQNSQPPPGQPVAPPPSANWSTKNPICLQLEQRLVQDNQRTNQSRDALPNLETQIRQVDQAYQQADAQLERGNCYEYFLFSKTLRRTRGCVDLARQREDAQRRLADLDAQRQQILGSSERSYRDDIVRELARNNCGANYQQEARHQDRRPFSSIWQDEESGGGGWAPFGGAQSYATYRTICVRLCDGYFFPVSFSTLPSHFEQDAAACQSKCAAPVQLFYYQNPGAAVDQSVALHTQEPYTSLKTAFRYRKELVKGCSCKEAEYVPPDTDPTTGKRVDTGATTGWEARSEPDAKAQAQ